MVLLHSEVFTFCVDIIASNSHKKAKNDVKLESTSSRTCLVC